MSPEDTDKPRGARVLTSTRRWFRRYCRALVAAPAGRGRTSGWVIAGCLAVSFLVVCTSLDAAANGRALTDDFTRLRTDLGLVAADDFSGPPGSAPSSAMWNVRTGGGGWGNGEKQVYTSAPDNVAMDGAGHLRITARRTGSRITSARVDTLGKLDTSGGLLAVRAKLPEGQGLHPAIWMLGSSLQVVGYPEAGEIDIVEQINTQRTVSVGALGPRTDLADKRPWKMHTDVTVDPAPDSDGYHTYWVHRQPGLIEYGIDERTVMTLRPRDLPPSSVWVLDEPFFLVLNLAVGGEWPGPVAETSLPATMFVDWVRMYA